MVSGAIAYPFYAGGVMLASILSDMIFWKKKFNKKQIIGLLLMMLGIIIINIWK